MATKQQTRNRDYSQHFELTYELNYNVYKFYVNTRNNHKIGYMKRMKEKRDNLQPDLNHPDLQSTSF